jgi:hypothetical protein
MRTLKAVGCRDQDCLGFLGRDFITICEAFDHPVDPTRPVTTWCGPEMARSRGDRPGPLEPEPKSTADMRLHCYRRALTIGCQDGRADDEPGMLATASGPPRVESDRAAGE